VKLSYDAIWQDMVAMMKAHAEIILVVAGVFLFLPMLAQSFYLPPPVMERFDLPSMQALVAYYQDNLIALLGLRLLTLLGAGTLLALFLSPDRPTVGGAIGFAGRMLPSLFFLTLVTQFLMMGGLALFIVPGLYVAARTSVSDAAMIAEGRTSPFGAVARSFELTRGIGWQIFGLVAIIWTVMWIASSATVAVIGIASHLLLPEDAANIARAMLAAVSPTVIPLAFVLLSAALYRQLSYARSGI